MKRRRLELTQQLSSVPIRNEKVRAHPGDDGRSLVVEVQLQYPVLLKPLRRLLNLRDYKRFHLDAIGREVYESIDGKKSFEELIDLFSESHKLTFFESRALLMQYVEILMKRGLVVIGIRQDDEQGRKKTQP
jgi:hypothetical protein